MLLVLLFCLGCLISYRKRLGTKTLLMILADALIVVSVLFIIPQTRSFLNALLRTEDGVTGWDRIWTEAWNYYLEGNPLIGHGLGTQIERIMTERLRQNVNTHNMYLYILNCGGLLMMVFYVFSIVWVLQRGRYRHHYLIPFLIAFLAYGFFEMASAPFDYWHLSNMFTVCLFFIPSALSGGSHHHRKQSPVHTVVSSD